MKEIIKNRLSTLLENSSGFNSEKVDKSKIKIKRQEVNGLLVFSPFYYDQKMGAFRLEPIGNDYSIFATIIYDRFRGQGIGLSMYKYIIKTLRKEGKKLYSDTNQTNDALKVWTQLVNSGFATTTDKGFVSI
jgi:predicted GNAT family acetyltransferase